MVTYSTHYCLVKMFHGLFFQNALTAFKCVTEGKNMTLFNEIVPCLDRADFTKKRPNGRQSRLKMFFGKTASNRAVGGGCTKT